ncbi:MAG TPA: VOC family protein [Hyphomicrobiales bacterium]|nr:VOC family protein [Hyphomicrobiales bacterium]
MTVGRFDHVAIEVGDLDAYIARLTETGALRLMRRGALGRSGQRIAMLGDGTGVKIELIERPGAQAPVLAHLAFRCDGVDATRSDLMDRGWRAERGPNDLADAHARSALLSDGAGLYLQVLAYRETSPDIAEWPASDTLERADSPTTTGETPS